MSTETLWLVMTRTCNLDCTYCYQGSHQWQWQKDKDLDKHISDKTIAKALEFATDWTTQELSVIFYGGEPLLQFDKIKKWVPIWKLAFLRTGKKIRFSVTTNGTLLNEEVREFFDEHGISFLLSLDGPPWIHDKQRFYHGGKPSWDKIQTEEILQWRPNNEIAWQIDPSRVPEASDLQWMIDKGFKRINFNLNWNTPWPDDKRLELIKFMRWVGRRAMQGAKDGSFSTNFLKKFNDIILKDDRAEQPCGTGLHMLGLSPEGWLYPSQEMVFTVVEPNRAPGTEPFYRVGNVHDDPVIDQERLAEVSTIRNDQMVIPEGFDCNNCAARPISFGGCHCRYVGADGVDPSNRYDVLPGWCQTSQGWIAGFLLAAMIEKYIGFRFSKPIQPQKKQHKPVSITDVLSAVEKVNEKIDNLDILRVEKIGEK